MNCIESESIASAYMDQQMTQSEAIKYHAHIENCGDCQAYLAELREMSVILGSVRQSEVPAELRLRIMAAVTDEKFWLFAQREAAETGVRLTLASPLWQSQKLRYRGAYHKELEMPLQNVAQKFKTEMSNHFTRTAVFIGAIALVVVPFALSLFGLSVSGGKEESSLPWYIWTIVTLLLLLALVVGRYMFRLKNHDTEDISIRPKNH